MKIAGSVQEKNERSDNEEVDDDEEKDPPTSVVRRYTCPIAPRLKPTLSAHSSMIQFYFTQVKN